MCPRERTRSLLKAEVRGLRRPYSRRPEATPDGDGHGWTPTDAPTTEAATVAMNTDGKEWIRRALVMITVLVVRDVSGMFSGAELSARRCGRA